MLPQHILAPSTSYQTCIQTSAVHTKNANTIVLHSGYKNAITPVYNQCTSPKMRTLPYCAPQKCEPLSGTLQDYGPTTHTRNANSDLWHRQIYWGCAFKKCGGHTNIVVGIQILLRAYKNADTIQKVWTAFQTLMQALDTHCRHQKCEQHPGAVHKKCG